MANLLTIVGIILVCVLIVLFYIRELNKTPNDVEFDSTYSLKSITDNVAKVFADTQRENLSEQNLSKLELAAARRKKRELKDNLKTAAYGDPNAKKFILSTIADILQSKQFGIGPDTIDKVIAFNYPNALDNRIKVDIVFYIYHKMYGNRGFNNLILDYGLNQRKPISELEEEKGTPPFEVSANDIQNIYMDLIRKNPLNYDDKLSILARRVFADYKGFGPVDWLFEFALDEIDCGVSGVPHGLFEVKKEMITENFEYSYDSVWVLYSGRNIKMSCMSFGNQDELVRVCKNIYKYSAPHALTKDEPYVVATMKDGSRISVIRPAAATSWSFFARKFDSVASVDIYRIVSDDMAEIPITLMKWMMKSSCSSIITGGMGTGKTTLLRCLVSFIPGFKNIGVYEIAPELNLQITFPKKNITSLITTPSISMQELFDFGKKTNRNVSIIGEIATAEMGVIYMQSASVASDMGLGTHHAKTTKDLVLSLRDYLTSKGGYSSEKVAEEAVVKAINFDIHLKIDKEHRYIERITEIIPIRDRSYPFDKNGGQMTDEDTVEYYRRSTDRQAFTTRDIVVYKDGKYVFVNPISEELMLEMRNKLSEEQEAIFMKDMQILAKYLEKN